MNEPGFKFRAGQVRQSFPALNCHYVRIPGYGDVQAMYAGSGGDALLGHKSATAPVIGSWVMVACPPSQDSTGSDKWPFVILCGLPAASNMALDSDEGVVDSNFARFALSHATDRGIDAVQSSISSPRLSDYGFNIPDDLAAGSTAWTNAAGGILSIGDFLAQIGVSSRAFSRFNGIDHSLDQRYDSSRCRSNCITSYDHQRGDLSYTQREIAANILEAYGGGEGIAPVVLDDDGVYKLLEPESQRPFNRHLDFAGGVMEGEWRQIRGRAYPTNTLYQPFLEDEHLLPMISEQRLYDGSYRLRAARSLVLERRALGLVVEAKADPRNSETADPDAVVDTRPLYERLGFADWVEYRAMQHLLDFKEDDADYAGRFPVIHKDTQLFLVRTGADLKEALAPDTDLKLPVLAAVEAQYDPSQLPGVTLPEDDTKKLLLLASMLRMSPDGDVVLSDAYGSEVRLSKGRLILSAAVSVEVQSGRDVLLQAPRTLAMKAGRHAEVSVSGGDFIAKAETNLHLLGGNGGTGSTVVENRANESDLSEIDVDSIQNALARGSGVVIRSRSGVASYSRYQFHGGYQDSAEPSQTGCAATTDIVVNAGNHHLQAVNSTVVAETSIAHALRSGSAFSGMNSSGYVLSSINNITVGSPRLHLDTVRASVNIPWLDADGYGQHNRAQIAGGPTDLVVQGNASIKGNTVAAGNINTLGISSRQGINGNHAAGNAGSIDLAVPASQQSVTARSLQTSFTAVLSSLERYVNSYGVATDRGQVMTAVAFPASSAATYPRATWFQVQSKWQQLLDSSLKWRERDVTHAIVGESQPFPGKEAQEMEGSYIRYVDGAYTKANLNQYPVNYD